MAARKEQLAREVEMIARASLHRVPPAAAASRGIDSNRFLLHRLSCLPGRPSVPPPRQQPAVRSMPPPRQVQPPPPPPPPPPLASGNKRRRESDDDEVLTDSAIENCLSMLNTPELVGLDVNLDELLGPGGDDHPAPLPPARCRAREFEDKADTLAGASSDDDTLPCPSPVPSATQMLTMMGPDSPTPEHKPHAATLPTTSSLLRSGADQADRVAAPNLTCLDMLRGSHF